MRQYVLPKTLLQTLVIIALAFLSGCSSKPEVPAARIDPATAATVSGRVSFGGTPPQMPVLDMSANPACEKMHPTAQRAEQVIVNGNGTLRNAFVWVKAGLPTAVWSAPAEPAKLDQDGCVYKPHVLGLMVGQPLEISNSDTINHNVHAESSTNASWNESQPPRAEKKMKQFSAEEVMFPVTCSVHPWMRGYIAVVSHPFFAVTGDDGTFTLKGIPPGTYTVQAVHEQYGKKEISVTLAARETKELDFAFSGY